MKTYKLEVDAKVKGQQNIDNLNESLDETQQEQEGVNDGFNEMGATADKATGGIISSFMALKSGVMASVKSLGVMKVAIAATGLGALLLVITSIKAAFTSSEEGQNKYNKLMNALGVITGNIIDLFAEFGMVIIEAFENPQQAIKDLWQAIKDNIMVRVQSVIDMFGLLGKAIKQVFEGDWDGAMESAKEAGSKYIDVLTGVEGTLGKVKDGITAVIDETIREIEVSNRLSDIQAKLAKDTREQLIERATLEGRIADLKLEALDTEKNDAQTRMSFIQQAMELNDQLFAQEEELARMRLLVRQEQNKLSGSTAEDLMEEAQLEADLIRLSKQRADAKKEMFSQFISAQREYNAELEELAQVEIDIDQDIADSIAEIETDAAGDSIATEEWVAEAKDEIQKISAQNTIGLLGGMFGMLADLSEADFERQKKFKIAESVMSTVQGGISAFMGGVATIPGPFGVALGAVLAGITLATGFANVQKIRSSTPNSAGSGGGSFSGGASRTGEGSIPTITAPTAGQVTPSTAGEQRINDSISDNNTTPIKTYAVSSDMTSQQELDRRIESKAAI